MAMSQASEQSSALREQVLDDIRVFVHELRQIEPERIQESSHFREDLDLDSIDLAAVATRFEEKYDITLDDERVVTMERVRDAVAMVVELIERAPAREE